MKNATYITITGIGYYYGDKPFEVGSKVRLRKDYENEYDEEAILVEKPYIGKIGYVANSCKTIVRGTMSAGRLYDRIGHTAFARIMFVLDNKIIAEVVSFGKDQNKHNEPLKF